MACREINLVLKASPKFMISEKPPYKAWQWDGLARVSLPEWANLKNPRFEKEPFRIVAMSANYHRFQLLCITIHPTDWLVLIGEGTEDERIQSFTDQFVRDNFMEDDREEPV